MSKTKVFFDTHVLLYLLSADTRKANQAEQTIAQGGIISAQVLNEFCSVASRKLKRPYAEIRDVLITLRRLVSVEPLTEATHNSGMTLAERYGFCFYDSLIVAAAFWLDARCFILRI